MEFITQLLRFINLLTAALIFGGQVMVYMVILPTMRRWGPGLGLQAHRGLLFGTPDKYMVPSAIICPLSALGVIALHHKGDLSTLMNVIGIVGAGGVTIASVAFAEPLSRRMENWSEANVPAEFTAVQSRWDSVHTIRTVAALIMMAAFIVAALTH